MKTDIKKLCGLAIVCIAMLVSGCTTDGGSSDVNPEESFQVIRIDGCEYIFLSRRPWSGEMALAHKGSCDNHASLRTSKGLGRLRLESPDWLSEPDQPINQNQ